MGYSFVGKHYRVDFQAMGVVDGVRRDLAARCLEKLLQDVSSKQSKDWGKAERVQSLANGFVLLALIVILPV